MFALYIQGQGTSFLEDRVFSPRSIQEETRDNSYYPPGGPSRTGTPCQDGNTFVGLMVKETRKDSVLMILMSILVLPVSSLASDPSTEDSLNQDSLTNYI